MSRAIKTIFFLGIFLVICGCSHDQYAVERDYWKVKKQVDAIFKNPEAVPPNELERVVGQLNKFVEQNPKNVLALEAEFTIARIYLVKDEFEQSRKQLKSIMAKYAKSPVICSEALFMIGNTFQAQDNWQSALEQYKKVINDYPLTTRGLETPIYIAQYYKVKFQPDKMLAAFGEAIEHYRALAEKYKDTPLAFKAYTLISSCYSATKDWPNTINTLNTVMEKFKGKVKLDVILLDLALIYKKELKDTVKTKETLERLIREYPDSKFLTAAKTMLKG